MTKIKLQTSLFFSHLILIIIAIISLVIISKTSSHRLFSQHLDQLENLGVFSEEIESILFDSFQRIWNKTTLWALCFSTVLVLIFSNLIDQKIVRPLAKMEKIARQFAAGYFSHRVPASQIAEIDQLANSFNRLAISLDEVEQRRRELIGDLTHELRTPLTVLRCHLEEAVNTEHEPALDTCRMMVKETRRLERLVNDLQELSKAESGHLPLNLNALDLIPLLKEITQKLTNQLWDGGPKLQSDYHAYLPKVLADRDRVEQILVNLLSNAIRHTEAGFIFLRAWSEPEKVWIAVQDTGCGIAEAEIPLVFERFWRSSSTINKTKGSGIGLAITKRLVELQGGNIQVSSELAKGTTFKFCLPLA